MGKKEVGERRKRREEEEKFIDVERNALWQYLWYKFLRASITNDHNFIAKNHCKFIFSQLWRPESKIRFTTANRADFWEVLGLFLVLKKGRFRVSIRVKVRVRVREEKI